MNSAPTESNVLTLEQTILRFAPQKRNGRKVVFTNGCFDLLHPGHIRSLESARALGDFLIVGINSDSSVRALKGPGRPVIPQDERAEILASLECVDAVLIFDEPSPRTVIAALLPDILVKGGDWPGDKIVGREEVEAAGGRFIASTSSILHHQQPSSKNLLPPIVPSVRRRAHTLKRGHFLGGVRQSALRS